MKALIENNQHHLLIQTDDVSIVIDNDGDVFIRHSDRVYVTVSKDHDPVDRLENYKPKVGIVIPFPKKLE